MKFSAKHSVKRLVAYASGNTNQYDDMVRTSGDFDPVLCVINHDDLLNIEEEIRSAYEAGYQDANKNAEPAMTDGYTYKEENCECGLTEDGVWSDEVFDRFGCTCDEEDSND